MEEGMEISLRASETPKGGAQKTRGLFLLAVSISPALCLRLAADWLNFITK